MSNQSNVQISKQQEQEQPSEAQLNNQINILPNSV